MTAFLGVALLGVLPGIGVAVALSILNVFRRAWWPDQAVLGRVDGIAGYHDLASYPDAEQVPGLTLFRFGAPLIFANVRAFREGVRALVRATPPPRWIVVTAEPMTDIDTSAADVLAQLHGELEADGIELVFAELKDPVRRKMVRFGLMEKLGPASLFPTIEDAVAAFRRLPRPRPAPEEPFRGSVTEPSADIG
jgi:MFS superfamily sulfate permease-like transporter